MKTKYVCRGPISLYVKFHNNRTMWSTNLHVKICRWGGGGKGKRAVFFINLNLKKNVKNQAIFFKSKIFIDAKMGSMFVFGCVLAFFGFSTQN